jgi:hypothetical protein
MTALGVPNSGTDWFWVRASDGLPDRLAGETVN